MKGTTISIIVAAVIIAGTILISKSGSSPSDSANASFTSASNVAVENGVQVVSITARGGYEPRVSVAKAGIPTVIRFVTAGTFDCSSSIRIPNLGIFRSLPQSGTTDVDIGSSSGGTLYGSCGMGMYPFQINFQ